MLAKTRGGETRWDRALAEARRVAASSDQVALATTADGLSKVASVLGVVRGFPIVQSERAEARVVRKPGAKIEEQETRGFRKFYRTDTDKKQAGLSTGLLAGRH